MLTLDEFLGCPIFHCRFFAFDCLHRLRFVSLLVYRRSVFFLLFLSLSFLFLSYLVCRSDKLKPFWLSITEKEKLPQLDFLAGALLSRQTSTEYRRALARALRTPNSRVVPFFGVFIRDLKATLSQNPSIIVVASNDNAVPILRVTTRDFF